MSLRINNQIILSWWDIQELVESLCERIQINLPHVESVTGIKRGGLIPAVMVSHKLGLPYVDAIHSTTLVVDDICDTGKTLKKGVGVHTACLYFKPHTSKYSPSVWAKSHNGDEWIIFPWEKVDSEHKQDYLKE